VVGACRQQQAAEDQDVPGERRQHDADEAEHDERDREDPEHDVH
jgi:hypothetical protein